MHHVDILYSSLYEFITILDDKLQLLTLFYCTYNMFVCLKPGMVVIIEFNWNMHKKHMIEQPNYYYDVIKNL